MKKILQASLAVLLSFSMCAVFAQNRENGMRNGNQGWQGRSNRGFNRGGNREFHQNPRAEAEKKLKERYPAEFAEIQKLRDEAEKKLQALAKKANITLPEQPKSFAQRMEDLKKKYPKEMAEYETLLKTDRRAAFTKLREIMQKEGFGKRSREDQGKSSRMRTTSGNDLNKAIKKYPEDWKKIQEIRRADPAKARKMTRELLLKYKKESRK